jgi:hypothetical protein
MNRRRQYVSQSRANGGEEKGRYRGPDDIDHRPHVGAGPLGVGLPIRYHFVQIQNRLIVAETDLIKQGNVASKLFPNEDLVVSPHRNDEVDSLDQLLVSCRWTCVVESAPFSRNRVWTQACTD